MGGGGGNAVNHMYKEGIHDVTFVVCNTDNQALVNPAQILPAFLIGILLAWTYYKTGSLIPCILMHVLNNSLSVYLSIKYPEAENMDDLINGTPYLIVLFGSILLFIGIILTMNHLTSQKQQ